MTDQLGRRHPTVRRLRALRRDAALRRTEGVFVAEGVHLALEAFRNDAPIELVAISPRFDDLPEAPEIRQGACARGAPLFELADTVLESLQDARTPQPVLTLVGAKAHTLDDCVGEGGNPLLVLAHGIQDPGNMGSILRTADAAGATGLLTGGGSADLHHPRAVRASMGSIFRLPTFAVEGETLAALRRRGLRLVGTAPGGGTPYRSTDLRGPLVLLLGAEGRGLPPALSSELDEAVSVPMRAGVESLSVGAAAAVLLFEVAWQRGAVDS